MAALRVFRKALRQRIIRGRVLELPVLATMGDTVCFERITVITYAQGNAVVAIQRTRKPFQRLRLRRGSVIRGPSDSCGEFRELRVDGLLRFLAGFELSERNAFRLARCRREDVSGWIDRGAPLLLVRVTGRRVPGDLRDDPAVPGINQPRYIEPAVLPFQVHWLMRYRPIAHLQRVPSFPRHGDPAGRGTHLCALSGDAYLIVMDRAAGRVDRQCCRQRGLYDPGYSHCYAPRGLNWRPGN